MKNIKFGTSGFRGIVGDNWTKETISAIANAFGDIITRERKNPRIIIGFDNRFMGATFAQWFCDALPQSIAVTMFSIPTATPVIAYKVVANFDYGIMITASHNPHTYNGVKIILPGGKEAGDEFTSQIEQIIQQNNSTICRGGNLPPVETSDDYDYIERCLSLIDTKAIKTSSLRVLFNAMHGSSAPVITNLLDNLGIKYESMNTTPDPYFGGKVPAPYAHNLLDQCKRVVAEKFNLGFALDGDGDRVTFIDADGKTWDCNYLMAVFYKKFRGTLVKNHLSSNLASKLAELYGEKVIQTPVGFKFLGPALETSNGKIAAESTGIAFKNISLVKDGIFATVALIEVLALSGKTVGQLIQEIIEGTSFPTYYLEMAYTFKNKPNFEKQPQIDMDIKETIHFPDGIKICYTNGYWAAARLSGTEAVARLYVEMPNESTAKKVLANLEKHYSLHERQK